MKIIDNPSLLGARGFLLQGAATFLLWLVWFYLWVPLANFTLELFGLFEISNAIPKIEYTTADFSSYLSLISVWILMVIGMYGAASRIPNNRRPKKMAARVKLKQEIDNSVADFFNLEPSLLTQLRTAKSIRITPQDQVNIIVPETMAVLRKDTREAA